MSTDQKNKILFISTILLVVIHLAGVIGILSSHRNFFLLLSPFNLLLSTSFLFLNHKDFNKNFGIFCIVTFFVGLLIELIGVRTGLIFGHYMYGASLGVKIAKVPLIIGINWLMLIYAVGSTFNRLNTSIIIKSISGAGLLVIFDLIIEPVAIKYDFWFWSTSTIPMQNYIAWFFVSFALLLFFYKLNFRKENSLAKALLIVQLVFFTLLRVL